MKSLEKIQIPEKQNERIETVKRGQDVFTIFYAKDKSGIEFVRDVMLEKFDDDGKKKFSINFVKYLPEGWKFNTGPGFNGGDTLRKEVIFPVSGLSLECAATILLHEIGHAVWHERHIREGAWPSEEDIYNDPTEEAQARNERDAWTFALKEIRNLKSKGIVAEDVWDDWELLRNHVYTALADYDENPEISSERVGDRKPFTKNKKFDRTDIVNRVSEITEKEFQQLLDQIDSRTNHCRPTL